jgi:CelD/BcsL family acetyltransferase involved in cellulose biosynthesis
VTAAPLELAVVEHEDELAALAGWDDLVRGAPRPSPFLLHGWVVEWWRHLAAGRSLAVGVARRDGVLVGVLPLCVRRRLGVRVGEFLGGHESALADLLLAAGEPPSTAADLLTATRRHVDVIDLFGLPGESRLAAAAPSGSLRLIERVSAPYLTMPEGFEAVYRERTSSKTRNTHKRRRRQLDELGDVRFRVVRDPAELPAALAEAQRLHALRWQGRPDQSEFVTPAGREFHRAALERLAPLDVIRIVLCELDGVPIAHHYYFALDGRMVVHCLAFDPAYGNASVGLLTNLETLRAAGDEGLTAVEFLGGDERYKHELADGVAPLYQAIGLARGPGGHAVAGSRRAAIDLRVRLRESPTARRIYERVAR